MGGFDKGFKYDTNEMQNSIFIMTFIQKMNK